MLDSFRLQLLWFSNATVWKYMFIIKNPVGRIEVLYHKVHFTKEKCCSKITNSSICLCQWLFFKIKTLFYWSTRISSSNCSLQILKLIVETGMQSTHKRGFHLGTLVHYSEYRDYNCVVWFLPSFTNVACHPNLYPSLFWKTVL